MEFVRNLDVCVRKGFMEGIVFQEPLVEVTVMEEGGVYLILHASAILGTMEVCVKDMSRVQIIVLIQ